MRKRHICILVVAAVLCTAGLVMAGNALFAGVEYQQLVSAVTSGEVVTEEEAAMPSNWPLPLDTARYDALLLDLIDYKPPVQATTSSSTPLISDLVFASTTNVTIRGKAWPPANPYPHGGAILPEKRIVAYYGNFYSRYMGILGEYPREEVLQRLLNTADAWEAADPETPVVPAIHYIAMVAQADAGADGMYRNVMPDAHIGQALEMAREIDGIAFIDLQVGLSTIQRELPQFREWLSEPDMHLGLDPEFAMAPSGYAPGKVIGTYDAADINFAINWLSEIVREHQLPPKVLVVHRFTDNMLTNYQNIMPTPEVQVVIDMDGWGSQSLKRGTYSQVIVPEPVQFAGLKIFYKNDLFAPSTGIFSPAQALLLNPEPVYIQYQ